MEHRIKAKMVTTVPLDDILESHALQSVHKCPAFDAKSSNFTYDKLSYVRRELDYLGQVK